MKSQQTPRREDLHLARDTKSFLYTPLTQLLEKVRWLYLPNYRTMQAPTIGAARNTEQAASWNRRGSCYRNGTALHYTLSRTHKLLFDILLTIRSTA